MFLKCGAIIPFQYKDIKKLLAIAGADETGQLTICDVKNAVRSAFTIYNCEFYNKKIGFQIPDELLIPYLEQRHDLTNFVIEIVDGEVVLGLDEEEIDCEPPSAVETKINISIANESKRALETSNNDVPVAKKTKEIANCIDTHLEELLKTSEGQQIPQNSSNRLDDKHRQLLINLIAGSEFEAKIFSKSTLSIDNQRYLDLTAAVVRKFPGEDSTAFYIPPSKTLKRIAGGGLYEHFNGIKCRYLLGMGRAAKADFPELEHLVEIIDDWRPYFKAWRQSFDIRMAYVGYIENPLTYFEKFIACVGENLIELIEYDFERLHPGKGNKLLENWDQMSDRVFTEAIVSCRNDVPLILDLYGNMPQLSGFMMLGYFLENYESDVKAFQKDDPGNLVVHIETIDGQPADVFKEYCRNHNQLDPMVFVTGTNTDELSFYVLVGDSLYSMETVLKAVDFCFKCYQVLQLSYPKRQNQVWLVIQKVLYDICRLHKEYLSCENFLNIFKNS